jgi:hypothetical protein
LWLNRYALAYASLVNRTSDSGDGARKFVAQNKRLLDHEWANLAVLVVVNVASANTDGSHLHQNLIGI